VALRQCFRFWTESDVWHVFEAISGRLVREDNVGADRLNLAKFGKSARPQQGPGADPGRPRTSDTWQAAAAICPVPPMDFLATLAVAVRSNESEEPLQFKQDAAATKAARAGTSHVNGHCLGMHNISDDGNPAHEGLDIHVPHREEVYSFVIERVTNGLQVKVIQDGKFLCSNMSWI
jgi:hypothetical protein